jgi:hypothetical protein
MSVVEAPRGTPFYAEALSWLGLDVTDQSVIVNIKEDAIEDVVAVRPIHPADGSSICQITMLTTTDAAVINSFLEFIWSRTHCIYVVPDVISDPTVAAIFEENGFVPNSFVPGVVAHNFVLTPIPDATRPHYYIRSDQRVDVTPTGKFVTIVNGPTSEKGTYATRRMRSVAVHGFEGHVIEAKEFETLTPGDPQSFHYDVDPLFIEEFFQRGAPVFVAIHNPVDKDVCTVDVGTDKVFLAPGQTLHFDVRCVHRGTGDVHVGRIYVLYCKTPLSESDRKRIVKAAKDLTFPTGIVPTYPLLSFGV